MRQVFSPALSLVDFYIAMKRFAILLALLCFSAAGVAQTTILTDAGREVLIREDGSWEFASSDQFATLPDGQRVRLKPDGSWLVDTSAPRTEPQFPGANDGVLLFTPKELVIETSREKIRKNVRYSSQSVVRVEVELSRFATGPEQLSLDAGAIRVKDSAGDVYPVLGITPGEITLQPGEASSFEIRAEGSPAWRRGKHYEIQLNAALAGTQRDIELEIPLSEARDEDLE